MTSTRRLPPGPRGVDLVRTALAARRDAPRALVELADRFGDVVGIRLGILTVYLLNHPDLAASLLSAGSGQYQRGSGERRVAARLLGNGLLASEDPVHGAHRRLIYPLVHGQPVGGFADQIVRHASRTRDRWREGQAIDLWREMGRTTAPIMVEVLFGLDVAQDEGQSVFDLLEGTVAALESLPLPFSRTIARLPLPSNRRFERARAALDQTLFRMIRDRREGRRGGDVLAALAAAGDGRGAPALTESEVRDEALSLYRGHKTTGTAIAWTAYLLSRHPQVEARFHDEVDSVLAGRLPRAEDYERLVYTRHVVAEGLRLYPPAWLLSRRAMADRPVGSFVIPKGSLVLTSPFVLHHDPRWWPDPETFDPDRFSPGRADGLAPGAYIPFGDGSKRCLGDEFAPREAALVLATIGQRWRLRLPPGEEVTYWPRATLKPRHGMVMVPEARP